MSGIGTLFLSVDSRKSPHKPDHLFSFFRFFSLFRLDISRNFAIIPFVVASVAHLVERHLAKVEVASSSLVTRSMRSIIKGSEKFF